jgi:hypothetical protein
VTDAFTEFTIEERQKIIDCLDEHNKDNPFEDLGLPNPYQHFSDHVKEMIRVGSFAEAEQALEEHIRKWKMVIERRDLDMVEAEKAGPIDPKTWLALTINAIREVDKIIHGGTNVEVYNP